MCSRKLGSAGFSGIFDFAICVCVSIHFCAFFATFLCFLQKYRCAPKIGFPTTILMDISIFLLFSSEVSLCTWNWVLGWHFYWHLNQNVDWHFYWHFYWHFVWHFYWHFYWKFHWHFYWHVIDMFIDILAGKEQGGRRRKEWTSSQNLTTPTWRVGNNKKQETTTNNCIDSTSDLEFYGSWFVVPSSGTIKTRRREDTVEIKNKNMEELTNRKK